jgi:DNA-binding response OmpR family regulator
MTVKDLRKDRLDGLRAGADDFLTKPADMVELTAALETAKRILSVQFALQARVAELEAALAEMKQRVETFAGV